MAQRRCPSFAFLASMKTLDRLNAWCRCATADGTTTRGKGGQWGVTYCRKCQGLIKPELEDDGDAE
jgi:hypothetical protein